MPRRKPTQQTKRSARRGADVDWKQGRHKKSDSAEVRTWEDEFLVPEQPPWMDATTYTSLNALRNQL